MNQVKVIKTISLMLLLCGLLVLGVTSQALAEECVTKVQLASPSIGSRCTEDPSCVIIGGTHMLEWKSPAPAKIFVVCIHGLGLCARAYKPLAQELSAAGIDGFGVNVRGFGPDRDRPDRAKLNCLETAEDVSKLLSSIHKEHPDYKVFLVGESMGGRNTKLDVIYWIGDRDNIHSTWDGLCYTMFHGMSFTFMNDEGLALVRCRFPAFDADFETTSVRYISAITQKILHQNCVRYTYQPHFHKKSQ